MKVMSKTWAGSVVNLERCVGSARGHAIIRAAGGDVKHPSLIRRGRFLRPGLAFNPVLGNIHPQKRWPHPSTSSRPASSRLCREGEGSMNEKILIVDDEPNMLRLIGLALEPQGYGIAVPE